MGGGLDLALTTLSDRTHWRIDSSPQQFSEMILSKILAKIPPGTLHYLLSRVPGVVSLFYRHVMG